MPKTLQIPINSKPMTPPNATTQAELLANVLERIKIIDDQNTEQAAHVSSFLEKRNYAGLYCECLKPLFEDAFAILNEREKTGNRLPCLEFKQQIAAYVSKYHDLEIVYEIQGLDLELVKYFCLDEVGAVR